MPNRCCNSALCALIVLMYSLLVGITHNVCACKVTILFLNNQIKATKPSLDITQTVPLIIFTAKSRICHSRTVPLIIFMADSWRMTWRKTKTHKYSFKTAAEFFKTALIFQNGRWIFQNGRRFYRSSENVTKQGLRPNKYALRCIFMRNGVYKKVIRQLSAIRQPITCYDSAGCSDWWQMTDTNLNQN